MIFFKNMLFSFFFNMIEIISLIFIITIFYYYNIISWGMNYFLEIFVVLITIFINSFIISSKSTINGYKVGIRYSLLFIILQLIVTIILSKFQYKLLLYFGLVILSGISGGIFGLVKRKRKKD